jgi:predicted DNA-binding transcriptional regulator AlpA
MPDLPPNTDLLPVTLTKQHWAFLLDCSERTIDRLIRSGRLPDPLPLPGRKRWGRDAALAWINGSRPRRPR